MVTGVDIQKLVKTDLAVEVTANRLFGSVYGVTVAVEPESMPRPICHPGASDPAKFDSLDEVVSFLAQVGIKRFQVTI